MGYWLYSRDGVGDHSREDWIRGTCTLLPQADIITSNPEGDLQIGLGLLGGLFLDYRKSKEDILLLPRPVKGMRGILWGWPVDTLHGKLDRFEKIVVPDRRSLLLLRDAGIEKKIRLGPDLSFLVQRQIRPLAGAFRRDTVGLCLGRRDVPDGVFQELIRYILMETTLDILIIPYHSGDVPMLTGLARPYQDGDRVRLRTDGDSRQLRGDISLCRCVVGMEGAVAAWSCGVPALCLGVSGRTVGLAVDLFGSWQETVVPLRALSAEGALVERFQQFLRREHGLRRKLEAAVPQRREFARQWKFC
ncbi:MAG: polysaccharide pyruvyl transferase family protein [Oscillospiraceae bacterium]|nr:polysaccharide pyruvyl transferase family protein [Oscillospiraceae bacterium]